ncbi:hypothetical protein CLOP_g18811 [Closterium sp. NIES-67]|nr:hypothetical protein CLOP_g18811 [Closterium sp. NIES-67]
MAAAAAGRAAWFDAHCHLQDPRIAARAGRIVEEAAEAGVKWIVCNGTHEGDWDAVSAIAAAHPCIIPSFGLHPWYIQSRSPHWLQHLERRLMDHPHAAMGEAGLHRCKKGGSSSSNREGAPLEEQVWVMCEQLQLARRLRRPIALHCVQAHGHMLKALQQHGPFPAGVILHSFSGPPDVVSALVALNAFFSFSLLSTSSPPHKLAQLLKQVPPDRLLLETDAPDGLPAARRRRTEGRRREAHSEVPQREDGGKGERGRVEGGGRREERGRGEREGGGEGAEKGREEGGDAERGCCVREERDSHGLREGGDRTRGRQEGGEERAEERGEERGEERWERGGAEGEIEGSDDGRSLNTPANIRLVCETIAGSMGRSDEAVAEAAFANAVRLFSFPGSCVRAHKDQDT